ncbi:SIR2 family protein [Elizabethkingia meningoseptica]|uniref:SIR2 family protein n=1 Tax=Elizabethkingia meningoseptica TaxID=238 RepID=UPI0023AF2BE8|nr:SIR2 family protein [Elizabethkingia meningoseptica]MDE5483480.1 SIR2 family protein [Elizabethkingia meningoseptica]
MKTGFQTQLENHLKKFSTSPYLFVGSGLSSRYINTEGWGKLLGNICSELKLPNGFFYYNSKANNDLTKVSSLMAEDLFEIWWKDDAFQESRDEYADQALDIESPIKFEISKYFNRNTYEINSEYEGEYNLFKKINVEGIITTNWDILLEKSFPEFNSFIGQNKLIFNNSIDVGEIYKIHGCVTNPTSLVLTENDYSIFHKKNPYLAAKLLTIFMEHPIIFLGYNIGDPNIHGILNSIITILDKTNIDKLKDRLIFCERDNSIDDPVISDGNLLISGLNLPILRIRYKSLDEIYKVLANNNRRLPIKILRHMKHMVFDFVKNSKSKSKVYLADETNIDKLDMDQVQFVYGFGIKENLSMVGVKGISSKDLLLDIIYEGLNVDPVHVAKNALPLIQGTYLPYFKYLRLSNFLDENGIIPISDDTKELAPDFIDRINCINHTQFYPLGAYLNKKSEINNKYNSVNELIAGESEQHSIIYIPLLDLEKINPEEIYTFVKGMKIKNIKNKDLKTDMRRLICLYDYLKYKLQK